MVKIKVGLIYGYSENWIGGSYYIINLISALRTLPDNEKPEIFLIAKNINDIEHVKSINYPFIHYLPVEPVQSIPIRIVNKLSRTLFGKNWIRKCYSSTDFDWVYPYTNYQSISKIKYKIYWIPDFQELYFPNFFSKEEIALRHSINTATGEGNNFVIFSSKSAESDFDKFYPSNKCKKYVLYFASVHPKYEYLNFETLRIKYNIPLAYFISANQFWEHKNHFIILKSLVILRKQGVNCMVVFTGKENDFRNPDYFDRLKAFVHDNKLQENVKFLGFIDRIDQLKLMNSALAIIQPSLFEGWSTVVEDAKAMNQYTLLSNIAVHKEQLNYNVSFFDPTNEMELASKMVEVLEGRVHKVKIDYKSNVNKFGMDFMNIIHSMSC